MFYVGIGITAVAVTMFAIAGFMALMGLFVFTFSLAETLIDGTQECPMPWDSLKRLSLATFLAAGIACTFAGAAHLLIG